jgi:hypothetical protein
LWLLLGALVVAPVAGSAVESPRDAAALYELRQAQAEAVRTAARERCSYQPTAAQPTCERQAQAGYDRALNAAVAERDAAQASD